MRRFFLLPLTALLATAQSSPSVAGQPPVLFAITHVEAGEPQIIMIFNLEETPRKMVLPPAAILSAPKSEKPSAENQPQIIRILNLGEGTNEIALPPVR